MNTKRKQPVSRLKYLTSSYAPGYRDLTLIAVDPETGQRFELHLPPGDVERVMFACADVVKQIGNHPPLDWDQYRATIHMPQVTPWMPGPVAQKESA